MSIYAKTLESLQQAMLNADAGLVLPGLKNNRPELQKRLNIYIAGYRTRLVQAILSDYPALIHYLGDDIVTKLARDYVEITQSSSYTLHNIAIMALPEPWLSLNRQSPRCFTCHRAAFINLPKI